mmetsp:Transcript_33782/g.73955  ORF Transcript_33782/g.73955 Transcript_33782/m.73955 type:complete len:82 (+) Transcript_33782:130-375(+)
MTPQFFGILLFDAPNFAVGSASRAGSDEPAVNASSWPPPGEGCLQGQALSLQRPYFTKALHKSHDAEYLPADLSSRACSMR